MGGRGSSSGMGSKGGAGKIKTRGVSVSLNGETTEYYFHSSEGTNYYQRLIDGKPQPTPNNMTMQEFINRAKSNGASVKKISDQEIKRTKQDYKKDREKTNEWLNDQWYRAAPRPRKGWRGH